MSVDDAWLIGGWCLFALVAFHALPSLLWLPFRSLKRLAPRSDEPDAWPLVSVIVAARDEEVRAEEALRGLLASDYENLQIIFADDRSTDATGAIADRLAADEPRLTVIHIEQLPDGWLGKNHAMHVAAQKSEGKWLLFTDGDILLSRSAIRDSIRFAESNQLGHFCLLPSMETASWMECVLTSFFAMLFCFGSYPWLRKTRFPMAYYGVGAFNLVRRSAYEQVGGHQTIRMDILDDVNLGRLLKESGVTADALVAGEAVKVRWQDSAWGVIRGLEKNAFAACRYSVTRLIGFTVFYCCLFFLPLIVPTEIEPVPASGFIATVALLSISFGCLSSVFGGHLLAAFWYPVGAAAVILAFWRSAWITLKNGGVRWRNTFYSLKELRDALR